MVLGNGMKQTDQTLLEQLRLRFGSITSEVEQTIQASQDAEQLAEWLRRFANAKAEADVGIVPPR